MSTSHAPLLRLTGRCGSVCAQEESTDKASLHKRAVDTSSREVSYVIHRRRFVCHPLLVCEQTGCMSLDTEYKHDKQAKQPVVALRENGPILLTRKHCWLDSLCARPGEQTNITTGLCRRSWQRRKCNRTRQAYRTRSGCDCDFLGPSEAHWRLVL
jgi:hypothetical protein